MKFTGSKLDLAEACPASMALPWVTEDGEAAGRGNDIHAVVTALTGGKSMDEALLAIPETWRDAARASLSDLPVDVINGVAEMAVAINPFASTARLLGENLGRKYPALDPEEIPLTIDWYGLRKNGLLDIDWKTGFVQVRPASENLQVGAGALALSIIHKRDEATVALVYLKEDEEPFISRATLDAFALDEVRERLQKTAGLVARAEELVRQGKEPDVHRGLHCRYCPAHDACPSTVGLIRHMASGAGMVELSGMAQIDPTRMPSLYKRMREFESLLKRVKEEFHHYAMAHEIALGNGMVYGPVESRRETVDGDIAYREIRSRWGQDAADKACGMTAAKTSIREAAKMVALAKGEKIAPVEKEMLDAVRQAGGISAKVVTTVKEHS